MDKPKQLTFFDCAKQASKWCRISTVSNSEECNDVIVCEAEDKPEAEDIQLLESDSAEDPVNDTGSSTTECTKGPWILHSTSQTTDKGDGHLEQIQESHVGSPDVGNESDSEIADNESSDLHMAGSSCSKATSALHTQYEPYSAGQTTTDIAQSPTFPLYNLLAFSFQKRPLVTELGLSIQHGIKVMSGLSIVKLNACFWYPCRLFGSQGG